MLMLAFNIKTSLFMGLLTIFWSSEWENGLRWQMGPMSFQPLFNWRTGLYFKHGKENTTTKQQFRVDKQKTVNSISALKHHNVCEQKGVGGTVGSYIKSQSDPVGSVRDTDALLLPIVTAQRPIMSSTTGLYILDPLVFLVLCYIFSFRKADGIQPSDFFFFIVICWNID